MSNRRHLVSLGIVVVGLLLVMTLPGCGGGQGSPSPDASPLVNEAAETPLFTFACIGDTHIGNLGSGYWMTAGQVAPSILANAVSDINNSGDVDFTVVLGDISENGKLRDLQRAKSILDGLKAPYIPIVGNHDNFQRDNFAAFHQVFGTSDVNYSWDHKGFHFVTASSESPTHTEPLTRWTDEVMQWVRNDLQQNAGKPTILLTHHALFDYKELWGQLKPKRADEFRQILEQAGNVVMCISGHVHRFAYKRTTVGYAVVGAPLIYPAKIMYYHVYRDRVVSDPRTLSAKDLVAIITRLCPSYFRKALAGHTANQQYYTVPVSIPPAASVAGR